jgi:hypothetical protein
MAEEIGTLVARVVADNEQFRSDMQKMSRTLDTNTARMNGALATVNSQFGSIGATVRRLGPILGVFGVSLSAVGLVRFGRDAIAAGSAIDEMSRSTGIGAESLQRLRFAFHELAGATDNEVDKSLERFNRKLGEAISGNAAAARAFAELGITTRTTSGEIRGTEAVLEEALRALAAVESEAVRAAQASALFGDEAGPNLAAALRQGIAAMNEAREAARGIISDENVALARALNDEFDRMAKTVGGTLKNAFIEGTARAADMFGADLSREAEIRLRIHDTEQMTGSSAEFFGIDREAKLAELRRELQVEQARAAGVGGFATSSFLNGQPTDQAEQLAQVNAEYDGFIARIRDANFVLTQQTEIQAQALAASDAAREAKEALIEQEIAQQERFNAARDAAKLANEEELAKHREMTEAIRAEHDERLRIVAESAAQQAMAEIEAQRQAMQFRLDMAQAVAGLAHAVFGEQKAVGLALIAFEQFQAFKRIKMASQVAAWQAFQSQLIPGVPTSIYAAKAAYAATLAAGNASAIALSVIGGLADAARVVGSSGAPGSFTNPLSVAAGSSIAGGALASADDHRENVTQIIFKGPVYGWDEYIKRQVIAGIREAITDSDIVIIDPQSRQGQMLLTGPA